MDDELTHVCQRAASGDLAQPKVQRHATAGHALLTAAPRGVSSSVPARQSHRGFALAARSLAAQDSTATNATSPQLPLQAKLEVGAIDDPLEHEADRVAQQVIRMTAPATPPVARCACGGTPGPDGECAACRAERLARVAVGPAAPTLRDAPRSVHAALAQPGSALDQPTRAFFEPRLGRDLGDVRVLIDGRSQRSAKDVNARAYTVGTQIVFAAGQYAPTTPTGRALLAHELVHTMQQASSPGLMLQRQRNYHAGGCATCRPASVAGTLAHPKALSLFVKKYTKAIVPEAPIHHPTDDDGRLDLLRITRFGRWPKIIEYGEIKPDNDRGLKLGRKDLHDYGQMLNQIFRPPEWRVSRIDAEAPSDSIDFMDNDRPKCPKQHLTVRSTGREAGLYLYKCQPPGRPPNVSVAPCCYSKDDEGEQASPKEQIKSKEEGKPKSTAPEHRPQPQPAIGDRPARQPPTDQPGKRQRRQPERIRVQPQRVREVGVHPYFQDVANRLPYTEAPAGREFITVIDDQIYNQVVTEAERQHLEHTKSLYRPVDVHTSPFIQRGKPFTAIAPYVVPVVIAGLALLTLAAPESAEVTVPLAAAVAEETAIVAAAAIPVTETAAAVAGSAIVAEVAIPVTETAAAVAGSAGVAEVAIPAAAAAAEPAVTTAWAISWKVGAELSTAAVTWAGKTITKTAAAAAAGLLVTKGLSEAEAAEATDRFIGKRIVATADVTTLPGLASAKPGQQVSVDGQSMRVIMRLTSRKF